MTKRKTETVTDDHIIWNIKPPKFDNPACDDPTIDPEIFFPVSKNPAHAAPAKAICRGCPEVMKCAEFAMSDMRIQGVWGGLTWEQRIDLHRQIKLAGN